MTEDSPEFLLPPPPNHRQKKTRELPNLSDCHCCNRRINCTNPKNRLRILTSEWRIVLLCSLCYNLVESSRNCSYCLSKFLSPSIDLIFDCLRCNRRIHKDCVGRFSFGSGDSDDFDVCYDCRVPDLLVNEYFRDRSCRSKKKVKICEELVSLESNEKEVEKKGVNRGFVAKRAVDGVLTVEDDAQLAIRLHRAMNSSPRIARNSLNSSNLPALETSANVGVEERGDGGNNDLLSCREVNGLCLAESREDEKCKGGSNGCLITYSRKRKASVERRIDETPHKRLLKKYVRKRLRNRNERKERHNAEFGRYFKTYSRRISATSHRKSKVQNGGFDFQHGVLTFDIDLNCCEESKPIVNISS